MSRYHIYCVGLRRVPEGRWHCQECAMCNSCSVSDPGPGDSKWFYEVIVIQYNLERKRKCCFDKFCLVFQISFIRLGIYLFNICVSFISVQEN